MFGRRLLKEGFDSKLYLDTTLEGEELVHKEFNNLDESELEIEIHTSLSHPHIVPAIRYEKGIEMPHLRLNWLEATTKDIDVKDLLIATYQILSALDYCHENGIIHQDIKPSNILSEQRDFKDPMLIDFGCAARLHCGAHKPENYYGTRHYLSYEQLARDKLTAKTDIANLGSTIYHIDTDFYPNPGSYARSNPMNSMMQVIEDGSFNYDRVRCDILRELLESMMQIDPDLRPNAREAMQYIDENCVRSYDFSTQEMFPDL